MEIKETLNLPRTDFPMRARLPEREPEILARWQKQDLYGALRRARRGRPVFLLHDGPPYANGRIHLGTAMNKILKDLVVRCSSMAGYDVPFVPGWDCHGMPIEHNVTRKMREEGDPALDDILAVRRRCAEYAEHFIDVQRAEFQRLGGLGAWESPYRTMQPAYEVAALETFRDLVEAGYIYNGLRSIHWCACCQTALAEAEVEYHDHTSPSIYVRFPLVADDKAAELLGDHLPDGKRTEDVGAVIWTTTPWTIPANLAIAVHPDLEYLLVATLGGADGRTPQDLYLLAEGLAEPSLRDFGHQQGQWEILARFRGRDLEGLTYRHPLFERTSPIILAEHVTLEAGTGLVHTAPGHGHEDFEIGRAYDLDVLCPVDEAGVFDADAGVFQGTFVFDANADIIEALQREFVGHQPLLVQDTLTHSYPHCWRCKSPLIYRATEQWFLEVDANDLRQRLLGSIREQVRWVPEWGMERISSMVEGRPDWCLSRQRAWGVPIPAVSCIGCKKIKLDPKIIEKTIEIVGREGSDAWFSRPVEDFLPDATQCDECAGGQFEKERDIFDVWFESGVSHRAVLSSGEFEDLYWPSDLYLEGHDQHRGWFQVSLITAVATRERAPYETVVTHGFIVDEKGRKMSKSLGNVSDPRGIWDEYGADILRLYFASVDYSRDTPFSKALLEPVVESYRKIRNTLRFLLANLFDFDPHQHRVEADQWQPIDRWAVGQAAALGQRVTEAYESHRFHPAVHRLHEFCTVTMSATYLDIIKDRLYISAPGDTGRRAAQTAIHLIADALTRWLAPVLPFTAEDVWQHLPDRATEGTRPDSVHLETFTDLSDYGLGPEEANEFDKLMELREEVLGALERDRERQLIGSSLEAAVFLRPLKPDAAALAERHAGWLADLFIVSQATVWGSDDPSPADGEQGEPHETADGAWQIRTGRAEGAKCERCWTYKPSVGEDPESPTLCARCRSVLAALAAPDRA